MQYSLLGQSGLKVSKIGLGTALFGVAPRAEATERVVGHALDLGINLFDTANSYGNQARFDRPGTPAATKRESAEELLGRALRGRRDEVVLCSKVMEPVGSGPNDWGLSRRHIMQQVERSLTRLGTDRLDIYYAHHPHATTPLEETIAAFDTLVQQGKILHFALSNYPAWETVEALWASERIGARPPVCNQIAYNLAARGVERELVPAAMRHGLSLTVFSPLAGGLLAGAAVRQRAYAGDGRWGGKPFDEGQLALAQGLERIASENGLSSPALALGWLLQKPVVAAAIVGPESVEELTVNATVADIELSPDVVAALTRWVQFMPTRNSPCVPQKCAPLSRPVGSSHKLHDDP